MASNPYKTLVVGAGGHATAHWLPQLNIHGDFVPCGIVDTNPEVLEHAPATWNVEPDAVAFTIDEALATGIHADVALICTPIETHHGLAIEAMRNGLHVICEKNMARSMQAALEMTQYALDNPELATVVGHQYPYWRPANWAIRKAIGTGEIGKLGAIECNFNSGFFDPTRPTRNGWRRFLDHEYLEDWAVHTIDLFRYFTAMDAVQVSADLWRPAWSKRYGTTSISIRMKMAPPSEYEGDKPLAWSAETERARRLCESGKTPADWVHATYTGHAEGMGMFDSGEHWRIQGDRGSIEYIDGGCRKETKARMFTCKPVPGDVPALEWSESNMQPYPVDLECGPAKQWAGDNTEEEWGNNCLILEQVKQCIESKGKIKPARCFENCIKTFAITMAAIESSNHGGRPVFLPATWDLQGT